MTKIVAILISLLFLIGCAAPSEDPITLRLEVALTPEELASFEPALQAVDDAHPEWQVELELTPQDSFQEKINTQLASNTLPDVVRTQGLVAQGWIRQNAFLDITPYLEQSDLDQSDFFEGPLSQFEWQDTLWGLPDTAAPDVVFYNKDMFDAAGLDYPTDSWTFEDMRDAARLLTLDSEGRNSTDPDFDPTAIEQWGWNGGLTFYWQRHLVQPFGGDFCETPDCTLMNFTQPATVDAVQWWADFTSVDHATLYDPYGGSQTGIPGDPFIAGKAAMGFNGFFAVGQLDAAGTINYDIVQPFVGQDGNRYTPLSTNGYMIAANSEHPDEAWALIEALLADDFLANTWGKPGHSVPALRDVADSILDADTTPENKQAIIDAMEYGDVFRPHTTNAFAAYGATAEMFMGMMSGERDVETTLPEIEAAANDALAPDRNDGP